QKWADYLDKTNQFKHDANRPSNEGENLYAGSASYTAAVDLWASEKKCFKNGAFPDIYNGKCDTDLDCKDYKDWHCSGHYSQIVWRDTKQVGCGMANGIVVCRYSPPGNFYGKKTY
ncbi:hypothetical protein GWN26_13675, partial [Candidatus Saccharibacteria bacterium]|nr:hypothetical protein [Calditrichia bacterium]NIW00106.1 hypothetical protein [Candidatus Saccharibacteria bacterium]